MARKYKRDSKGRFAGGSGGAGGSRLSASARGNRSIARSARRRNALGAVQRNAPKAARSLDRALGSNTVKRAAAYSVMAGIVGGKSGALVGGIAANRISNAASARVKRRG